MPGGPLGVPADDSQARHRAARARRLVHWACFAGPGRAVSAVALLAALLAHPAARCEPAECRAVVQAAVQAEGATGVSARVLVGVCLVESGCRPGAIGRPYRGRDWGAWQLHLNERRTWLGPALASVAAQGQCR
jgi:hypothetical protein